MEAKVSEDGEYLLQRVVPVKSVKRVIDWKALNVTPEYIKEQSALKNTWDETTVDYKGNKVYQVDKRKHPTTPEEEDRFFVTELCLPYNPPQMIRMFLFIMMIYDF